MFKKFLFVLSIFIFFTSSFSQNIKLKRSSYLDQRIVDAKEATNRGLPYQSFGIGEFIIDTIPHMPGIDSNYYLGMAVNMLSAPYFKKDRSKKEAKLLLEKALDYYSRSKDAQLGFEIHMNFASMFGLSEQLDTAHHHLQIALDLSTNIDPDLHFEALDLMSYHYRFTGVKDSSIIYLNKIKEFIEREPVDSTKQALYYFGLGEHYLFFGGGNTDELWLKAINLIKKEDVFRKNGLLNAYSYIKTTQNDFKTAYEYQIKYSNNLEDILNKLSEAHFTTLDKINKKMELKNRMKILEFENKMTKEKSDIQQKWIGIVSFLALIILLGFVFIYRGYKKQQELNKELEKAKNKALEVAELKSNFSETVSHELRTPLHGVIGLTSILISDEKENLSPKGREYLDSLKFSGDYLLNLINDVLQISKVDAKKLQLENTPFDFKFLISNLTSSFQYLLDKNEVKLNINVDNNIPRILIGDAVRLSQIIINLVGNAIKFTQKGEVNLRLILQELQGNEVSILFEVEDTGIGIPEDKQSEIFEKFTQITSNSSSKGGTGLGLPIVKELLLLHNSQINLTSKEGKGSKFWFTIQFKFSNSQTINNWDVQDLEISKERKRVLIVDDNEINRIVSEKILEKYNFDAVLCENGLEALNYLDKDNFDVVLMDLHMPKKDGKETIVEFRKIDSKTPVILLTASNIENEWLDFKALGFTDYIIKPYDRYDFLRKIMKY